MKYKICLFIMILFIGFTVQAEGEATIKNIKVNGSACSCSGYDCNIEVLSSNATITYELVDTKATVDRLSGFRIDLLSEITTVKITVSNTESSEKIENIYNISIKKVEKENDYSLKSLSVNDENIEIVKDVVVYSYTAKYDTQKITVKATPNDSKARANNQLEYAFPLTESSLAIDFSVVASDGKKLDYRIVVTRDVKPDTTLKSLKVEPGNIIFDEKVNKYKFNVEYSVNEIKIDAVPSNKDAKVTIDNQPLVVGENKITITVSLGDSKTEYILFVIRDENVDKSVANLKEIKIDEYPQLDFKENVLDYILKFREVPNMLSITAKSKDASGKIEINGNEELKDGSKIIIKNTLEDSNIVREYTLLIKESKELHENKTIVLISIIGLVITIIILIIIEVHSKKQAKRNYLKKIFELRHKIERKRKEEKSKKKTKEEDIEII